MFTNLTTELLAQSNIPPVPYSVGKSRSGRAIKAYRFGNGPLKVSLIAGCHADEPTGPMLLSKLVNLLTDLPINHTMLNAFQWWIIPHINPDGAFANRSWQEGNLTVFSLVDYLKNVVRELPGDDIEFGFPIAGKFEALRAENTFAYEYWTASGGPFHLHASLHGMNFAYGAWYLLDEHWWNKGTLIKDKTVWSTLELGYPLHDIDRKGEKGFHRLGEGFCTRPNSAAMRRHFLDQGADKTAALFRPSSMESIRSLGGDCLTMVTELPLFLVPNTEPNNLKWPNPDYEKWKMQFGIWKAELDQGLKTAHQVGSEAAQLGVQAMPVQDQMKLQWAFVCAGLETIYLDYMAGKISS